jgi:putative ABC transport system substrate-binding protein
VRRRDFIAGMGSMAWPFAAGAQQQTLPGVAVLFFGSESMERAVDAAFREGLGELGFRDGQNIRIFNRRTESYDRLPTLYGELAHRGFAIMASMGAGSPAVTATAATPTIPVVFLIGAERNAKGLMTGLDRPAGHAAERFNVLAEMSPAAKSIGYLHNPTVGVAEARIKAVAAAARARNLTLAIGNASTPDEIEPAFAALARQGINAVVLGASPLFIARTEQLVALAARHALPAVYPYREQVEAGGLMSYGPSISDAWHLAGIYAGRILKGESPADLPQPGRASLVINLQTANVLNLSVPAALVGRADQVIR